MWRGEFTNDEVNALHAEAFGHPVGDVDWCDVDWWGRAQHHSLGWVCTRSSIGALVGFVNVAWDGGVHAFLLDTMVALSHRSRGLGASLVSTAVTGARAAGCQWLHVDFETHLRPFYLDACGFRPTEAGLIAL
ncbi:GNAT family N-acetyltransferase [Kutzneria sp. CA-103260]|uniref:GNAT family N-acetyltransferase n=1 Tax=Kutzneria sp. CA-103260 TaxID=2802641 RepID=UPI001BA7532F|nr:GNAT family N-acetyltransferase [Kutzneria sp. CA-103260]QUQ64962.1 GNAT family N-acetyltransferase [Kutzneria sp. CA-103260]